MKRLDKKLKVLYEIYDDYESFNGAKSKLQVNIRRMRNIIEEEKYSLLINSYEEYKKHLFCICAKTNRIYIKQNTTPTNLLNLTIEQKKNYIKQIYHHYENYYNMGLKKIFSEIRSLKLILSKEEFEEYSRSLNSYKNYIINILSKSSKIAIYSNKEKPEELYYYDVFKVPE